MCDWSSDVCSSDLRGPFQTTQGDRLSCRHQEGRRGSDEVGKEPSVLPSRETGVWVFQSCGHCWVFQICWHIECSTFTALSFRIWSSSTGIPSPPLALFVCFLKPTWLRIPVCLALGGWSHHHGYQGHEELYKKDLHDPDNHDGVITHTHLEPDILECEVKWALESITTNKASGDDGTPVELFQILKDDAVKVLHSICQQIWKTQQWPQDWKRSVFIPIPQKGNAKECSTYLTIALISYASKVMLKILQARL